MADSKITALTSISTSTDPANDPLVIVDVSDTSMAATGTTKKVTLNNLLACSPTATLASAIITGDLTVKTNVLKVDTTNNRVGINNASPAQALDVAGSVYLSTNATYLYGKTSGGSATRTFGINAANDVYVGSIDQSISNIRFNSGGGDWAVLNSTGLGVGASPQAKLHVSNGATIDSGLFTGLMIGSSVAGSARSASIIKDTSTPYNLIIRTQDFTGGTTGSFIVRNGSTDQFQIDSSGNVGIGVVPSAWVLGKALEIGQVGNSIWSPVAGDFRLMNNVFYGSGPALKYATNGFATSYKTENGQHQFHIAPSGTAGNAITFTQAMTLDASGNLLVGTTSSVGGRATIVGPSNAYGVVHIQSNTVADTGNPGAIIQKYANDTTTSQILQRYLVNNGATSQGQINANGASQAAFGSYSDSRLKENIVSLPSQLANILSLRPVEFDYKDGSGHQIGFVAQEMQEVYSDAVGEQEGFLTVTGWSKTEARLVSAIKELAAKVQALEAKLA